MPLNAKLLKKFLVENKIVDADRFEYSQRQASNENRPLEYVLVDNDVISDENLGKVVAGYLNLQFVRLSRVAIPKDVLRIIPEVVARAQKIISFKLDGKGLHLAMSDPGNIQIREFIHKKVGLPVVVYYATERDIENALSRYVKDVNKAFKEIILESVKKAKGGKETDPPIIEIVKTILAYAFQNNASDVHIEPFDDFSLVRFRIDGVLHDIVKLPINLHASVVTRIKVLAKLRTDEHHAALDGKIQYRIDKKRVDIRVSIVPITDGEKVVMRLLSEKSRQFSLEDLGLLKPDLELVKKAYNQPHGMLLATGPTGSGKTTTLYAILKLLNRRNVNIMTIEDPVEYDVAGVNQIQVNTKTDLTFSKGLRSIVRQDPDIILVGEIRDSETAGIAINAGMTGHLVLSTLHTNDAATSIPRLLDMEVEPFLVASTVNLVIAQRLVRKICLVCRVSFEFDISGLRHVLGDQTSRKYFGDETTLRTYKGKGCEVCHQTGYDGRIGIFEVMTINDKVRQAIIERASAAEIKKIAVRLGMRSMFEDGIEKAKQGLTTMDEVLRVTR